MCRQAHDPNIVRDVVNAFDPGIQLTGGMIRLLFFIAQPRDDSIISWQSTTSEDQPGSPFGLSQSEPGMFQQIDCAVDQARLAGAAAPRPASMRISNALV